MKLAPVSVVIPCFNCAVDIERAVSSVMEQTLPPAEVILVEDCSADDRATKASIMRLVERYRSSSGPRLRTIWLERNIGPGEARNVGWNAATEEFVAFLDADDAWHTRKIEIQHGWMRRHPDYHGSGHETCVAVDLERAATMPVGEVHARQANLSMMLFRNDLRTRTVMLRRDVTQRFAPGSWFSEDYALWLDLVSGGLKIGVLDAALAFSFRPEFSPGGQSGRLWKMEAAELATYRRLVSEGKIGWPLALLAAAVSLAKYARRLFVYWFRAIRSFAKIRAS